MKSLVMCAVLLTSVMAFAGVQFLSDTQLSADMQTNLITALHHNCPIEMQNDLTIVEESTVVRSVKIDQGQIDYFYSTKFSVVGVEHDAGILVESVNYAIQNGDPISSRLVYGCGPSFDFQCVQTRLQNLGSDIYSDLKGTEIHEILMNAMDDRHETVVQAAAECK